MLKGYMKTQNTSLWLLFALHLATNAFASVELGLYVHGERPSPVPAMIDAATKTVTIAIYEMNDEKVLAALKDAAERGVIVSILKEPDPLEYPCKMFPRSLTDETGHEEGAADTSIHEESKTDNCKTQQKLVGIVNQHGGRYVAFNKHNLCGVAGKGCFQHGKVVVVDSQLALISSGNLNDTNLCDLDQKPSVCNRDYSVITDDADVIAGLEAVLEKDLLGHHYDLKSLMTENLLAKLTVSPVSLGNIVAFIESATTSIQIQNQYLQEPTLNAALVSAAKKGVRIEAMVSDVCNFKKPSAGKHAQITRTYSEFDKAGIQSKMFNKDQQVNGKPGYLHAKAIVVDGTRAWVGSMNGSTEAATQNREFGIYFDQTDWVNKLVATMTSDFNDPLAQTWKQSLNCQRTNAESEL